MGNIFAYGSLALCALPILIESPAWALDDFVRGVSLFISRIVIGLLAHLILWLFVMTPIIDQIDYIPGFRMSDVVLREFLRGLVAIGGLHFSLVPVLMVQNRLEGRGFTDFLKRN